VALPLGPVRARIVRTVAVVVALLCGAVLAASAPAGLADDVSGLSDPAAAGASAVRLTLPERRLTMAFTGDILPHSPLVRRALDNGGGQTYDFSPMFAAVAPVLSAYDLAICHLETPVAPPGEPLSVYPLYGVPASITTAIAAAGYDRCSTASNHTIDRGVRGVDATVDALEAAGVAQSGMARSPQEAVAEVFEVNGIRLAHLSYTYGLNGLRLPRGQQWRTALIDPVRIVADAVDARSRGAQLVIVSMHWGNEGTSRLSTQQRSVADAVTASGAVDLIVGHHAHVVQPIEMVNGRWVVYGLGNFLSNMPTGNFRMAQSQDGAIAVATVLEWPDGRLTVDTPRILPTWVDRGSGWVIRSVLHELDAPATDPALRQLLVGSWWRTAVVLGPHIGGVSDR
jgi:hypothetical protein